MLVLVQITRTTIRKRAPKTGLNKMRLQSLWNFKYLNQILTEEPRKTYTTITITRIGFTGQHLFLHQLKVFESFLHFTFNLQE